MIDSKLITFLSLCDTKNYTKTAEQLFITQPAVTHHIKALEKQYDIRLFQPGKKIFKLTAQGELLRTFSLRLLEIANEFQLALEKCDNYQRHLRLLATPSTHACYLRNILVDWIARYPNDFLSIQIAPMSQILDELTKGKVDFALVDESFDKRKYESIPASSMKIKFVVALNHPLATKKVIDMEDFMSQKFILNTTAVGLKEALIESFRSHSYSIDFLKFTTETNDLETVKDIVLSGHGISMFYECSIQKELDSGALVPLRFDEFECENGFQFVYSKKNLEEPRIKMICQEMIEMFQQKHNL